MSISLGFLPNINLQCLWAATQSFSNFFYYQFTVYYR